MSETEIVWGNPPHKVASRLRDWAGIAESLRSRPGEWAMVATYKSAGTAASTAAHIRLGVYKGFSRGTFEVRSVTPAGGPFQVYARFIGEPVDKA